MSLDITSDASPAATASAAPRGAGFLDALNTPLANRVLSIIGRLGLVYLFCVSALFHVTVGWTTTITEMVARGVPFPVPMMLLAQLCAVAFTLGIAFNVQARWCALGLALYVLTVSSIIYTPGSFVAGPDTRIFFMKDMAIFGALLLLSCALSANQRLTAQLRAARIAPPAPL